MTTTKRIAIIETGAPLQALKDVYGGYGDMFIAHFKPIFDTENLPCLFDIFRVHEGDALPLIDIYDGVMITGSPAGVYEDHFWLPALRDYIRVLEFKQIPTVGICFGHQLMVDALGGKVEKSDKGWGVGVHTYKINHQNAPQFIDMPKYIACAVSHQDQVTAAPSDAICFASSEFCTYGALTYGDFGLSFQQHPEFSHYFGKQLINSRRDRIPKDRADKGIETYDQHTDRLWISKMIAQFFKTKFTSDKFHESITA